MISKMYLSKALKSAKGRPVTLVLENGREIKGVNKLDILEEPTGEVLIASGSVRVPVGEDGETKPIGFAFHTTLHRVAGIMIYQ